MQENFLDYPEHYWDESNPHNMKLRQQMRDRYKRISLRVQQNILDLEESRKALEWCRKNGNPHKKGDNVECISTQSTMNTG